MTRAILGLAGVCGWLLAVSPARADEVARERQWPQLLAFLNGC